MSMTAHTSRDRAREQFWTDHDPKSYTCPDCGRGHDRIYQWEIHHKDGDPQNNDPENLIGLCRRCHAWRHYDGPTLSGLDLEEWKDGFASIGDDSTKRHTVYDQPATTECRQCGTPTPPSVACVCAGCLRDLEGET
ncbi:HNH endonuclease signature motif containing protein [Halovenus marina]|uniref:HNH endonuclease signature motif containing protein n=1 Tax=Halovenus marina TaxID=3396621 RepID=UPI003F55BC27